MRRWSPLPLAITLLGVCAPGARAQYPELNPNVETGRVAIATALVLPPGISFSKLGLRGTESQTPEADKLSETLSSLVSQELTLRGVRLLLSAAEPRSDAEKYALADLQARFDNVHMLVHRRPRAIERGRYSLGDGVSAFAPAKGADALVFVRGQASETTPGRTALSAFTAWQHLSADITFVNAKTGEVLAWAPLHRFGDMTQARDARLAQTIRNSLRDIPLPLKAPK